MHMKFSEHLDVLPALGIYYFYQTHLWIEIAIIFIIILLKQLVRKMMTFSLSFENIALRLAEGIREITVFVFDPVKEGWMGI